MNKINPKKLLNSKWTAVKPDNKEKHFIVVEVEFDDDDDNDIVIACVIEAVMTKRQIPIQWRNLKNKSQWLHGWK